MPTNTNDLVLKPFAVSAAIDPSKVNPTIIAIANRRNSKLSG